MTLELEGKIKTKLPAQGGTSARGTWTRQDFVVEYQDGNYPSEACFSAWGQERVDELARFKEGDAVKVSFNVRAREYGGRWYNDLRVWRLAAAGAPQAQAAPQAAPQPAAQPQAPAYQAPAPTIDDMPIDLGTGEDDLPF
ncbi:MAG: DUF3127 domain-containing protein [Bacteroidales bacterium]|nr:DUF3127 domain-containing protein [Bacteroidales bacterium]